MPPDSKRALRPASHAVSAASVSPAVLAQVPRGQPDRPSRERAGGRGGGKRVSVVGAGAAGLAAAEQLNRAGHSVTVFERADRIGGLLRYGIPEFKLEKRILERRLALMRAEGIVFRASCHVGIDLTADDLLSDFDAVVLAGGATIPRELPVPRHDLKGVHFAMDYLTAQNRRNEGDELSPGEGITAARKHVVIIGGGHQGGGFVRAHAPHR